MCNSRVCTENRCVSAPARKGHVEPRALDGARSFFFSLRVLQPARFGYIGANGNIPLPEAPNLSVRRQHQPPTSNEHSRIRSVSPHPHEANEQIRRFIWGGGKGKSGTTNEAHQIQNKQVDNSSQPGPKPKTTRVDFQKGFCGVVLMASTMLQYKCCKF